MISPEYYSTLLKSPKLKHVILKNISYLCYIYKRYFFQWIVRDYAEVWEIFYSNK